MVKLSIIMPVYNVCPFLERSVNSILRQALTDWELLLIDDGSTDGSGQLCEELAKKDERIQVFHKENGGAGSARNFGLDKAVGEFVAFPDSDDWIDCRAYLESIKKMEENNIDLLLFGSINTIYDKEQKVVKEMDGPVADCLYVTQEACRSHWGELYSRLPINGPSNKVYRRSIIEKHHLRFPNLRRMQDGVFNLSYYDKIHSFQSVSERYYHFTIHSNLHQRKKMPDQFIECAIEYHKTAISMLSGWGELTKDDTKNLGIWLSETVQTAIFDYYPTSCKMLDIYAHIRRITKHPYIESFFRSYEKMKESVLSKKEKTIRYQNNGILTLYIWVLARKNV